MEILDPVENFLVSHVATAPSPAVSGTSLTVTTGEGSLFPDPATAGAYNLQVYPPDVEITSANATIVRVTARSGDVLTITRDVEGSSTRSILVGDVVSMNMSAKMFEDIDASLAGKIPKTTNITALNETGIADGEIAVFNLTNKDIRTSNKTLPSGDVVGTSDEQTLASKTLTSPILNTGVSGTAVKDEDNMVSDSNTALATQQSIKAYADTKIPKTTNITSLNETGIADGEIAVFNLTSKDIRTSNKTLPTGDVVGTSDEQTLGSKTLTSPVINTGVSGTAVLDEDNMASNSATQLATQQSIKAYADGKIAKTTNITSLNETGIADGELAVFNLTSKDIRTSNAVISTDGALTGNADTNIPTEKAVKTYVDGTKFTWKGAWTTSTVYALNDTVEYNGSGYICVTAHTSGTWATDLGAGKWELFVEGVGGNSIQVDSSGGTSDTYGILAGLINGSNALYTVSNSLYISGSLKVFLNGQLQTQGSSEDWVETTPASGTFTFATAPATGDIITVEYLTV